MFRFTERGTVLGENKAIHPEDVRRIVEESYFSVCFRQIFVFVLIVSRQFNNV